MKKTKLITLLISILLILLNNGCHKEVPDTIGYSIYKTRGDYINNISILMEGDRIYGTIGVQDAKLRVDDDTICNIRAKLVNGYVLGFPNVYSGEVFLDEEVYLDFTFKEFIEWSEKYNEITMLNDTARKHILDKDPYIEMYQEKAKGARVFSFSDTTEMNQIILDGKLEEYFTKLK